MLSIVALLQLLAEPLDCTGGILVWNVQEIKQRDERDGSLNIIIIIVVEFEVLLQIDCTS